MTLPWGGGVSLDSARRTVATAATVPTATLVAVTTFAMPSSATGATRIAVAAWARWPESAPVACQKPCNWVALSPR
ncbi:hypothetical protein ACFSTC_51980 [Nonomuraea ferruginea]